MEYNILQQFSLNTIVILVLCFALVLCLRYRYLRFRGLPPGPRGLPVIGMLSKMEAERGSWHFQDLTSKYDSDIICVPVLWDYLMILNTKEVCEDVFHRQEIANRPLSLRQVFDDKLTGIAGSSGQVWQDVRKFTVLFSKYVAIGNTESVIQRESEILRGILKKKAGNPVDHTSYVQVAVFNIICGIVLGRRFDEAVDKYFVEAFDAFRAFTAKVEPSLSIFLAQYRYARNHIIKDGNVEADFEKIQNFVRKHILEAKRTFTGHEVNTLVYAFLQEQKRNPTIFDDKMLESLVMDYLFEGLEATAATVNWAIIAMACNPEIQKDIQKELDDVIGNRLPKLDDRQNTPFTEVVLCEVQRFYTVIPFSQPRSNPVDIHINNYRIPKHSFITANIYWMHHDHKIWRYPHRFDTENFLQDGKLVNEDKLFPFGLGHRACAGEVFAQAQLYLLLVSLVKNFDIRCASDRCKRDRDFAWTYTPIHSPAPVTVIFTPRQSQ